MGACGCQSEVGCKCFYQVAHSLLLKGIRHVFENCLQLSVIRELGHPLFSFFFRRETNEDQGAKILPPLAPPWSRHSLSFAHSPIIRAIARSSSPSKSISRQCITRRTGKGKGIGEIRANGGGRASDRRAFREAHEASGATATGCRRTRSSQSLGSFPPDPVGDD